MIWQEEKSNSWYTDEKMQCGVCGNKKTKHVFHIKNTETKEELYACWENGCLKDGMTYMFAKDPNTESLAARSIVFKNLIAPKGKAKRVRRGITKSIRYDVMNRDDFVCVLCGATGRYGKLVVDHIKPVSRGGGNNMDNLRTLCESCNQGKSDKLEGKND